MTPLLAKTKRAAVLIALATVAACARNGPPAPVFVLGGGQPQATPSAPAEPAKAPSTTRAESEPPKIEPIKPEPARTPPPPQASPNDLATAGPQAHSPHPDQVVVGKGETLYMIARRYDVPVRSILDANHLEPPFALTAGMSLTLPQENFHTVRAGDTLYSISRLYGVEVSTLASVNHLTPPFAIRVGETMSLPASVAPPERVAGTPPVNLPAAKPEIAPAPPASKPAPDQSKDVASFSPRPGVGRMFAWPLQGRVIASYGTAPSGTHNDGINIAARTGEPVRAADAGKVAYAGNELRGYGNLVLIKHAGGYMTAYAHNSKLLVKRGEVVKRGQEIAKAGATGTVGAPQLHFEIRQGTRALDPANYLPSLRASAD